LYAIGILQEYKAPARVAQQRIAAAQPLRHRSRSKRLSWPIALARVFASARIAAEPAPKTVGIEQLFHGKALQLRQCRRRNLAGIFAGGDARVGIALVIGEMVEEMVAPAGDQFTAGRRAKAD